MIEKAPRKPASFTVNQPSTRPETVDEAPRRPRAVRDLDAVISQPDVFALSEDEAAELEILDPSFEAPERKGWSLSRILFGALGILVSFAVGIWTEDLIRALFSRADWLGWTALGVANLSHCVASRPCSTFAKTLQMQPNATIWPQPEKQWTRCARLRRACPRQRAGGSFWTV